MGNKTVVIGIDSLDPYLLLKFKNKLPAFSKLIDDSPTFKSKSIFPTDTVPAWSSIYTGQLPSNHGILYVYDVFDPNLSDLKKIDTSILRGKTFWDAAAKNGMRSVIVYPNLIYPAWDLSGVMVSKSPFDKRIDNIHTNIELDVHPREIKEKYDIPDHLTSIWGGFPGEKKLFRWAESGLKSLQKENSIARSLYLNEKWDLFFVYFNILDIIQHRLWRYFDKNDPTYPGDNQLSEIIFKYYLEFDNIIGHYIRDFPESRFIILSDHGHKSRPIKSINLNDYLRDNNFLSINKLNKSLSSKLKTSALFTISSLHAEHIAMKILASSRSLTKMGKSVYSSSGMINTNESIAWLSTFAGIKSYSYGGIEINKKIQNDEYGIIISDVIESIKKIEDKGGMPLVEWAVSRDSVYSGEYSKKIFPDILFELNKEYCVGWDIKGNLFGKSLDHNVASGGHSIDAVLLMKNIQCNNYSDIGIIDVSPTIFDILDISKGEYRFDGKSCFSK